MAQLDLVATPVEDPLDGSVLLEAKSGSTGFRDLFTLFGQKTFLTLPKACCIRTGPPKEYELKAVQRLSEETGVRILTLDPQTFTMSNYDLTQMGEPSINISDDIRRPLIATSWYGRIAKRVCLGAFNGYVKSTKTDDSLKAKEYRFALEKSFFEKTPLQRARAVYDAYSMYPAITDIQIKALAKGDACKEKEHWNDVWESENRCALQFCLMMEHTARLRIIKNCLLHLLTEERCPTPKRLQTFKGQTFEVSNDPYIPSSCRSGLNKLRSHKHRKRIPFLLQLFIEVFGGFYNHTTSHDLDLLSNCTGIPAADIPDCLEMYGHFFPTGKGWFIDYKHGLRAMKMIPAAYAGTGAFLRSRLSQDTVEQTYEKRYGKMSFLLGRWHNSLYHIVEKQLKLPDDPNKAPKQKQ